MRKIYFLFLFVLIASMSGLQAAEKVTTFDFVALDSEYHSLSNITVDDVTFIGGGTGTPSRCWSDGLRVYKGGTLTFTVPEGYLITKIEFSDLIDEWNGSQQSVLFDNLGNTSTKTIKTITVTYETPNVLFAPVISGVVNGETYYGSALVSISYPDLATSMTYTITKDGAQYKQETVTAAVEDLALNEAGSYKVEASATDGSQTLSAEAVEFTIVDGGKYTVTDHDGTTLVTAGAEGTWTLSKTLTHGQSGNTKGYQLGSSKNPMGEFTLTLDKEYENIVSVIVNAATGGSCTLSVTVGGNTFGEEVSLTEESVDYEFTGNASGNVTLNFNASTKACYLKSITIITSGNDTPVTELTAPVITGVVNGETYYGSASVSISYPELATSMTYTITKDGSAGEPITVTSAVADLVIDEAGYYKIEATAFGEGDAQVEATPVEFTVVGNTEVASVADFLGEAASSENPDEIYEFTCPLTVAYQYDADIYVRDAEGGALLIYDKSRTYEGKYSMGDVIPAGATGKYDEYNGTYELIEATLGDATETAEIEPVEMAVNAITTADQSKYVVLKGVTIVTDGRKFVDADGNEIAYYNSFDVEIPTEVANYNVTGIVELFNNNAQISPIAFEVAEVTKCAAPEFSLAEGTYNETQTLTITSTEGSTIVYTINDEMQTAPSPAEIELPVDGVAVTYTIEAYATMEGAEDSEVVTKTYTIDPNAVVEQTESIVIAEVADEMGWMNDAKYEWFQKGGFKLAATGVDGTGNESGKYYDGDDTWRFYGNGTLTVTAPASVEIIKIEFTTGAWYLGECSTGVMSDGNKVWTSNVEKTATVSFTFTKASRIKSMNITYRSIPAGVEGVEAADAAIRANADGVVVVAADAVAEVYNAAGQLVATAAVDGESVIAVPAGFYVVRVGNTIAKVVVR